nr:hypothetical protein CFP56_22442 [Quercus suber]
MTNSKLSQDIEILQSKASSLRAGLPWAFRTADAHYVLDLVRQLPGGIPSHLHVNKVYYSRDVTAIVRDWDEVKEFGDGAAEEWRKGLPLKGKERMTDASRWERWESNLRPGLGLLDALREYHSASFPRSSKASDRIAPRVEDAHYVLDLVRQLPGGIPSHLHVNKVYYSRDVTAIVRDWDEVKEFGDGAAEEWRKGLPLKGKERMTDASRWERWESNLRPGLGLLDALREYHSASFPRSSKASDRIAPRVEGSTLPMPTNGMHPLPRPVFSRHDVNTTAPLQLTFPATLPVQRPMRNLVEVEQARQARRADIERRCSQLEPPLRSEVLQHIEAFQAAMQITTPMTDKQWDLLRPRILARREAAELFVHQKAEQYAALQSAIPSAAHDDASLKAAREMYEQAQKPLRQRLGEYADDIVIGQWHGGQGLHQHNAPGFAIQTLQHVYKRYTEDKHAGRLELDSTPKAPASAQNTPLSEPFLSLDNMKWVYENKVKPLTDQHCRDLFICAGCRGLEKTSKWFAFEGLIQHYGAKHTSTFSLGNIVVHWETAAWPGEPGETPFSTDQSAFMKIDRKSAGSKSHNYAHRTQQPVYDDQAQWLNHRPLNLSQEPHSPGRSPRSGTPSQYYSEIGRNGHHKYTNGKIARKDHLPSVPQSLDTPSEDNQDLIEQDLFADVASAFWDRLGDVENLMPCVRVQTVIHHAVENHYDRHGLQARSERPFSLETLINALHTNTKMVPMKEAQGLACKMCVAAQTNDAISSQSYYVRTRDVKLYSFPSLVTHFKLHHTKEGYAMFDWSIHMIELPENPLVADLIRAPGMNDTKLGLIAMAFPTAFPPKLPKIGQIPYATTDNPKVPSLASRVLNVTKKKRRNMKEAQGLACKMCVAAQTNDAISSQSYYVRTRDVKLYSFPSLVTHFKLHHTKEGYAMFDWSIHMIELPENPLVADLIRAPGMNDTKLGLIAMAFPTAFPPKLPKIGQIPYATTDNPKVPSLASRVLNVTKKKRRNQTASRLEAAGSAPAEDEYDPRRPSISTRQERTLDPARFDTDLARKSTPPPGPPAEFQLPTETIAKIRGLNMMAPQVSRDHSPQPSLESRSPSVGLAVSSALASPVKQVDLAAILATLTANMAKAPVASGPLPSEKQSRSPANTSPNGRMHPPISTYSSAQLPRQPLETRQSVWVPSYGAEPARSETLDLYAAMTHNVRQHDTNQQVHTSAENSAYLAPPLRYPSPFRHSPRHDAASFHRASVEDIPTPTSRLQHVAPPQYQYISPGDRGLMMDQYGRQFYHALIPVDDLAPRPTSYVVSAHGPTQPVPQYVAEQAYQEPPLIYRELPAPPQHSQLPDPRSVSRGPSLGSWR